MSMPILFEIDTWGGRKHFSTSTCEVLPNTVIEIEIIQKCLELVIFFNLVPLCRDFCYGTLMTLLPRVSENDEF